MLEEAQCWFILGTGKVEGCIVPKKCAAQLSSGSILVKVDFLPQDDEHCREAQQGVLTTSRFYLSGAAVMHDHQSRVDSALGRGAILKKASCAIQGRPAR